MKEYMEYAVQRTVELLNIDSPTGYTQNACEYVLQQFRTLGFAANATTKGGVLVDLGGEDDKNGILLESHMDTLGGMVAEVKGNGRLRITRLGGMNANNAEGENVRVVTKFDGV